MNKLFLVGLMLGLLLLSGCMCDSSLGGLSNSTCSGEMKFCQGKGMVLNDSYFVGSGSSNQFIVCKNDTGLATYQVSGKAPDGSFVGGLLVGWLLFSHN
jgi:hypothetical protein